MFCGKCGAEVPEGYEFCMKCGTKLDSSTTESATPIKTKKSKKWLIPVIAIVVIIGIVVVAFFGLNNAQKKSGLYNNLKWGTSYDDVVSYLEKNKEGTGELLTGSSGKKIVSDLVSDFKGYTGASGMVIYDCDDDGTLHEVSILIVTEDTNMSDERFMDSLEKELEELYGKSSSESYSTVWTTSKSKIELVYFADNTFFLTYTDIETAD